MAFTLAASVLIGQVPFLLGAAFGSAALLALVRRRHRLTVLLAAACSLSSPLAGAFLLLIALALVGQVGWRRAAALTSALSGLATAAIVGGAGGPFPCPWPSLAGVLGFGLAAFVMTSPQDRLVRHFALIYAAAGILAFAIPNPIGGNITRLGKLIALPLACYLLTGERRQRQFKAALCALAALSWTVVPVSTAIAHGATDPSRGAPYYEGLLSFLKTQNPATGR
ncbi:MAG TPA: hypothetical protein VHC49_03310, partial [Mycobacteriales bacterium]|nr:hypothetical protein [Mycobacteriales bacterium]